jgi:6,7-dimethyl-8-ribityllumazine synthase
MNAPQPDSPGQHAPPLLRSAHLPPSLRVAIVVSRYNRWITDALLRGAQDEFHRQTGTLEGLAIMHAPGSFELPVLARAAATSGRFQAVVCLGCIIKGETSHDLHIATAVANAITTASCETGVPIAFGVLTVDTAAQAEARAGGDKGNKGQEAMQAALDCVQTLAGLAGRA